MRARAAWAALICIVAVDAVIAVAKPSPLHFSESVVTRSLLSFASVAAIRLPRYSERKARLQRLSLRVAKGTVLNADEASAWNGLHERFEVKRINHQETCSLDGACTNWAEGYFSRLRRAEIGTHHHSAGAFLLRYAQESSWREDNRRVSNVDQVSRVAA